MNVRMLQDFEYKPTATDSRRCHGQLLLRPQRIEQDVEVGGFLVKQFTCGPMVTYFPKGATPELAEDIANGLIAAGIAERTEIDVRVVDATEIASWIKPQ